MNHKINLSLFFKDRQKSYVLNFPVLNVFNVINSIPTSKALWSVNNIELTYFDGNSFSLKLIRYNANASSTLASNLIGQIEKKNELQTIVRTTIKNSSGINISLVICILGGLIFLGKFLFFQDDYENLFWGILMITLFPFLLNWYNKVSDTAIRKNFEDFLYKGLNRN